MGRRRSAQESIVPEGLRAPLPFPDLPKHRRHPKKRVGPSRISTPEQVNPQPDLLDWVPPPTHLAAADVEAVLLAANSFHAPAGEAFLYHLTDSETACVLMAEGLPLAAGLLFRPAAGVGPDLVERAADGRSEVVLLRVRRCLIQPWLLPVRCEGRPAALLVPQGQTKSA